MPIDEQGRDENGDVKQAGLEDSNMAGVGGKENRDLRKAAAATEKAFVGAGTKVGLEVWRVENKRTENDTPDFGVARWPKEDYGSFYTGDSYIVLNTYNPIDPDTGKKNKDKLAWDVHFWLGKESSQDEIGVAAYKTVELDDLLDDGPVQHRETQEHESALFQSYFESFQYMEGGIASGFRKVKPEEYEPRLFRAKKAKKSIRAKQMPVSVKSLNQGDAFILDLGREVIVWHGEEASAFEKSKAGNLGSNIASGRNGKARKYLYASAPDDIVDKFWTTLGGTEDDVAAALPDDEKAESDKALDPDSLKVYNISDASGKLKVDLVFDASSDKGGLKYEHFNNDDVTLVVTNCAAFVVVGAGSGVTKQEKDSAIPKAVEVLEKEGMDPNATPITRLKMEGNQHLQHQVLGNLVEAED